MAFVFLFLPLAAGVVTNSPLIMAAALPLAFRPLLAAVKSVLERRILPQASAKTHSALNLAVEVVSLVVYSAFIFTAGSLFLSHELTLAGWVGMQGPWVFVMAVLGLYSQALGMLILNRQAGKEADAADWRLSRVLKRGGSVWALAALVGGVVALSGNPLWNYGAAVIVMGWQFLEAKEQGMEIFQYIAKARAGSLTPFALSVTQQARRLAQGEGEYQSLFNARLEETRFRVIHLQREVVKAVVCACGMDHGSDEHQSDREEDDFLSSFVFQWGWRGSFHNTLRAYAAYVFLALGRFFSIVAPTPSGAEDEPASPVRWQTAVAIGATILAFVVQSAFASHSGALLMDTLHVAVHVLAYLLGTAPLLVRAINSLSRRYYGRDITTVRFVRGMADLGNSGLLGVVALGHILEAMSGHSHYTDMAGGVLFSIVVGLVMNILATAMQVWEAAQNAREKNPQAGARDVFIELTTNGMIGLLFHNLDDALFSLVAAAAWYGVISFGWPMGLDSVLALILAGPIVLLTKVLLGRAFATLGVYEKLAASLRSASPVADFKPEMPRGRLAASPGRVFVSVLAALAAAGSVVFLFLNVAPEGVLVFLINLFAAASSFSLGVSGAFIFGFVGLGLVVGRSFYLIPREGRKKKNTAPSELLEAIGPGSKNPNSESVAGLLNGIGVPLLSESLKQVKREKEYPSVIYSAVIFGAYPVSDIQGIAREDVARLQEFFGHQPQKVKAARWPIVTRQLAFITGYLLANENLLDPARMSLARDLEKWRLASPVRLAPAEAAAMARLGHDYARSHGAEVYQNSLPVISLLSDGLADAYFKANVVESLKALPQGTEAVALVSKPSDEAAARENLRRWWVEAGMSVGQMPSLRFMALGHLADGNGKPGLAARLVDVVGDVSNVGRVAILSPVAGPWVDWDLSGMPPSVTVEVMVGIMGGVSLFIPLQDLSDEGRKRRVIAAMA